jgi:hypothetical protein
MPRLAGSAAAESFMRGCGPVLPPFEVLRFETTLLAILNTVVIASVKFAGILVGGGRGLLDRTEYESAWSSRRA